MFGLSEYMREQLEMAGSLFADVLLIGIVFVFCKWVQKRPLSDMGLLKEKMGAEYLRGACSGILMFALAFLICYGTGAVRIDGISKDEHKELILLFLLGYMVQGMAEELLCRGYIMHFVRQWVSLVPAIILNSIVFAAIHLTNSGISILAVINLFLFGIFASLFYLDRGSLWGVGAFHAFWNFTQGNILGVSVSGNKKACALLECRMLGKKELLHGGSFGLEGGLGVTLVMAAGILFLLNRNWAKLRGDNGRRS